MTFTPKTWGNFSTGGTPLNAAALVDMETRLSNYTDSVGGTTINAKNPLYGAVGDGITDDTAAIRLALLAAAGGGTVFLPKGTYRIATAGGLTLTSGVHIRGQGPGSTIINQDQWGSWGPTSNGCVITAQGSLGSFVLLTLDASYGQQTLTVTSTTGLAVGDILLVGANTVFATDVAANLRYTGEFVRVASVDSATQVTIYGYLRDNYLMVDSASFQKVTFVTNVGVSDLSMTNTAPHVGHTSGFIEMWAARDFTIDNVKQTYGDIGGVNITMGYNGNVSRLTCQDFTDDEALNEYGYGVFLARCTEQVIIESCHFYNTRHGISMGGQDGLRGIVRNCLITNCVTNESHLQAYDTHGECENVSFIGNLATNTPNPGFLTRGKACKFLDNVVENCAAGISIYPDAHGTIVQNNSFRHTRYVSPFGHGIMIGGSDHCVIENNVIEDTACCGFIAYVAADGTSPTNGRFRNNMISNSGISNIANNKAAIITAGSCVMTGWVFENNMISKNTVAPNATGEKESAVLTGGMDLAFNIEGTSTGNYFINNTTKGFAASGNLYYDDAATNVNAVYGNDEIDKTHYTWGASGTLQENIPGGRFVALSSINPLVSGRLHLAGGVILKAGKKYSSITFVSTGTAASVPTNSWAAFLEYDDGTIFAKTADKTTTAWGANIAVTFTFTTPYFTYVDMPVYCALMVKATTVPTLLGLTIDAAASAFLPYPAGFAATGLTTPASFTATGAVTSSTLLPYCYVS